MRRDRIRSLREITKEEYIEREKVTELEFEENENPCRIEKVDVFLEEIFPKVPTETFYRKQETSLEKDLLKKNQKNKKIK